MASSTTAILDTILPSLLLTSLSVIHFPTQWRSLRQNLQKLQNSFSEALTHSNCLNQPLFLSILPSILSSLIALQSLSDRCHNSSLPGGKLLLKSDLNIAASALNLRLHDLNLLIKSGLLRNQETAIVLLQPTATSSIQDLALFIRDLFTRLQIGGSNFRKQALESLIRLFSQGEKIGTLIALEGDVSFLINLMEASSEHRSREQAAIAVCFLATASEISRKAVFEEGGLGPLIRLLESGSLPLLEKAAAALESLTAESSIAWAVPAYGGINILVEACRSRNPRVRSSAIGSLKNLAAHVIDARAGMVEEGAVPVLLDLVSLREEDCARKKAVQCISTLVDSSGDSELDLEKIRLSVIQEGGLNKLIQLFREIGQVNSETAESVLRGILALCGSSSGVRIISSAGPFLVCLAETVKQASGAMQQLAAAVLAEAVVCEETKRLMAGAMPALVKLMEAPKPVNSQEVAARALVSLLAVRANRKELCRDEKSVGRLVALLDPANDWIRKEIPVGVIGVLVGGGGGCRRRLAVAGASQHLQKLAELEVAGARKAFGRMSGNRIRSILSSVAWRE